MEVQHKPVDRKGWPAGPWDGEPDRVEWKDEATGLPCLMVRHSSMGHWCGYVAVAPDHPLHGKDYELPDVSVHGGLTYADACYGDVCHAPAAGEPDNVWWFGFDCAHAYDMSPRDAQMARDYGYPYTPGPDDVYRDATYVRSEVTSLARQLAEVTATA